MKKDYSLQDTNSNIHFIYLVFVAYNQCAETLNLSESRSKDKTMINSIRAGGSTNFVAVFEALGKIFKNEKKKDSTVPHYIFMMTDGEDTCNKTEEIENAKEHLQVAIEGFGGMYYIWKPSYL